LSGAQRKPLIEQMSATKPGGETLLAAIRFGTLDQSDLSVSALENMHTTLSGHPKMEELWREVSARMKHALRFNGGKGDYVNAKLALAGPFTVEAWVRLDPDISNLDGILGTAGRSATALDMNFAGAQFRVWLGSGENDIVISKRKAVADAWTHYAVTRDTSGTFRIYVNGELDVMSQRQSTATYSNLDVARTIPQTGGTAGWITEYRVWNIARTPQEILANFDRSFAGEKLPDHLTRYFAAEKTSSTAAALISENNVRGKARVEGILEAPPLLTAAEARELEQKFTKFRAIAEAPGNAAEGRQLFTTTCLVCHQAAGQGAGFAPNLDGSALRGTEALLRALLTPSAAMEAGYRKFRVETKDGEIHEGFLAQQDASGVLLRQPNAEPMRIPLANIKRAGFQNVSIMPEGLLEALPPKHVSDLFAYLRSLK
jgi:putative heme-binding domain-containing protein